MEAFSFILFTNWAVKKGIIHSRITSPVTKRGTKNGVFFEFPNGFRQYFQYLQFIFLHDFFLLHYISLLIMSYPDETIY